MGQVRPRFPRVRSLLLVEARIAAGAWEACPDALVLEPCGRTEDEAAAAADWLRRMRDAPGAPLRLVSLGPLDSAATEAMLDAIMPQAPDALLLRGGASTAAIQHLGVKLAVHEALLGRAEGTTGIVADLGGAPADLFAGGGAAGSSRLLALTWSHAALASACGAPTEAFASPEGPGQVVRTLVTLAAAARGVPAYDAPAPAGIEAIGASCAAARRLGFAGRLTRDSGEVATINACFDRGEAA